MKPPTRVKIGLYTFRIAWGADESMKKANQYGYMEADKLLIRVIDECPLPVRADTLVHEIMHAIHWATGVNTYLEENMGTISEEMLTTITATGVCQVLKDNRDVFGWIYWALRGGKPIRETKKKLKGPLGG